MFKAYQQCIIPACSKTYDVRDVLINCTCGNLLDVKYDGIESIFPKNTLRVFEQRMNHGGNIFNESGVWRFRELLPFWSENSESGYSETLVSLDGKEGKTSPIHLAKVAEYVGLFNQNLWFQFEGWNPTGSFKDNGVASGTTHAKMVGAKKVACASTGNTSASMSAYAANEGIPAIVLIGAGKISLGKLAQTLNYGAKVIQIEGGDFDDAMKTVLQIPDVYLMNSVNPFRLEGQQTIVYRLLEGLKWKSPDFLVYPGGNLGNSSSAGKALMQLYELGFINKIPRLVIVNAAGANTLDVLVNQKGLRWDGGNINNDIISLYYSSIEQQGLKPRTSASAIEILKPVNLQKALRALEFTNGLVTSVTDEEIFDAQAHIGKNGFGCEPASAATVAGIKKLVEQGVVPHDATIACILTGHELKDPRATVNYHSHRENRFANPPITVTSDLSLIVQAIQ